MSVPSSEPQARKAYRDSRRRRVLDHYGGACACCGEDTFEFLAIDHKDGGGNKHRDEVGRGNKLVDWIIVNGFPPLFQVLCHNCNHARSTHGTCPHERAADRSANFADRTAR